MLAIKKSPGADLFQNRITAMAIDGIISKAQGN
jgi:hypothetical protein